MGFWVNRKGFLFESKVFCYDHFRSMYIKKPITLFPNTHLLYPQAAVQTKMEPAQLAALADAITSQMCVLGGGGGCGRATKEHEAGALGVVVHLRLAPRRRAFA